MKRFWQVAVFCIMIVAAIAAVVSFVQSLHEPLAQIHLPDLTQGAENEQPEDSPILSNQERIPVSLTLDTVQAVIETLQRPQSYERQITVRYYWDGGEGEQSSEVWVDSGFTKTQTTLSTGRLINSITDEQTLYQWYQGSHSYLSSPADDKSADLAQHIASYEDILSADPQQITEADYVLWEGISCIYAQVYYAALDYQERYWVSVQTGLLVHAQTLKAGEVVYEMSSYTVNQPVSSGVSFALPDGTVMHEIS